MLETLYEGEVAEVVARRGEEDVADLRQLLHLEGVEELVDAGQFARALGYCRVRRLRSPRILALRRGVDQLWRT